MPCTCRSSRNVFHAPFPTLSSDGLLATAFAVLLLGAICLAQEQPQAGSTPDTDPRPNSASNIVLPAGTHIPLVLTHPVRSRSVHRGDDIYAQITAPITNENQIVIPPGAFIQGKVDKFAQKGARGLVLLQSVTLTFPNGYVAPVAGPLTLESYDGYALKDPGTGRTVGIFVLPAAGAGLGTLIGSSLHTTQTVGTGDTQIESKSIKGVAIGGAVGLAAGSVASLVMLARSRGFYLPVGSPVEMVLPQPLALDQEQVAQAVRQSGPPVQPVVPPPGTRTDSAPVKGPFECSIGQEWCAGSCRDTISFMSDSSNCGRCNNRCSISESCTGGSCSCGAGYTSCMGSCVSQASFISDSSNCGSCGRQCSIGESCTGGTCMRTTPCPPGDITCH